MTAHDVAILLLEFMQLFTQAAGICWNVSNQPVSFNGSCLDSRISVPLQPEHNVDETVGILQTLDKRFDVEVPTSPVSKGSARGIIEREALNQVQLG